MLTSLCLIRSAAAGRLPPGHGATRPRLVIISAYCRGRPVATRWGLVFRGRTVDLKRDEM